jgi:hypothetical protein
LGLSQSETRKKATEREEKVCLQNVLRAYEIESKLEQEFSIHKKYRCEKHGPVTYEGTPKEIDGELFILCPKCSRMAPIMSYSADQWIEKLGLIIEQDGKSHERKSRLSKDEIRDQYLKDEYRVKIWRVNSRTSPNEVAEAVSLMLFYLRK